MAGVAVDEAAKQPAAYTNSWDHLSDELERLDLLIRLQLFRQRRRQPSNPLDQFRGLVVTETEVASLLADGDPADEDEFEQDRVEENSLVAALAEVENEIAQCQKQSEQQKTYLSLPHLSRLFQLTLFQQNVLLLALAPQLDRK